MNPRCLFTVGDDVTATVNAASPKGREDLLIHLALCGFVYFLSIEVAYAMFDPKTTPFVLSIQDNVRQTITLATAVFYFQEDITRNMAIGYGIVLAGQLLQSLEKLSANSTQPSVVKKISPKKISPRKVNPSKRKHIT